MAKRLCFVLLVWLLATPSVFAQLTRGAISGTVRDSSGAVVAGAVVAVVDVGTNQARTAVTDKNGFYRVAALEPAVYRVTIEKAGFARTENRSVRVVTAQETTFNPELRVSARTETLDVTAEAVGVTLNKTSATVGLTVDARRAVELPLSAGRDVNQLALLSQNAFVAPGSTGMAFNGQRARNNNFTIDGSDNNDVSVTLPTTGVPPEAVAEFQIQTNAYSAEFGRSSGGQLNVITKSGTNSFHGGIHEYYRASGMNALSNVEKFQLELDTPARLIHHQTGASLGGPIWKDKTFFFGLVQRETLRSPAAEGGTIRIPTAKGLADLATVPLRAGQSQASRQAVLDSFSFLNDVLAQNPTFTLVNTTTKANGVAIETGNVVITRNAPSDYWFYLGRIDHQFSAKDRLTLRYMRSPGTDTNAISNVDFGARFAGNQEIVDQDLAVSQTHAFGSQAYNEFRFSFIRRDLDFPENDPKTPTTGIGGMFTIGGATNFPQSRIQNSYQFSNVLTYQTGHHTLRVGADVRVVKLDNNAAFNTKGSYTFNSLQDFLNNSASRFAQALQVSSFVAKQTQQFYFAQDDFRVTPDLTLNLGLRYETSGVPLGFFGTTDPQVKAALVPGPVKRDKNNVAPRLGFNWSPRARTGLLGALFGDGRSTLSGGYGRSFDVLFYNILTVNASNYPRVFTGETLNVVDVFPSVAPVGGAPVFNPLASWVNTPEDAQNPEAHLYSLRVQREIGRDVVLEVGYTGSRSLHGINQDQANPAILTAEQAALVRANPTNTKIIPTAQARRLYPQFGSRTLISTNAQATYNAGYITINKRFSHGLQFGASYTFSKWMSNNDESLAVTAITRGSPQVPQDYRRFGDEKGLSAFDRTHRIALNYIWEIPWFKGSGPVLKFFFSGWQLAGITSAQSGQPFTILTGVDSNGNGTAGGDRPNLVPGGALELDPVTKNFRTFTAPLVGGRFFVPLGTNNLPLAYSLGDGNLGRNTYRAPGYWNTNLSLSKRFTIWRDHRIVLRVDALNVFNQDNYGVPVVSMNSTDFGKNFNDWGNRSLTLGARYSF